MAGNSKNLIPQHKFLSAQSTASNFNSPAIYIGTTDNPFIHINVTSGTPTGTFSVGVSGDHLEVSGNVQSAGNFETLPATQTTTAGSPALLQFDLNQMGGPWIQLQWSGSGTGTVDAWIHSKAI